MGQWIKLNKHEIRAKREVIRNLLKMDKSVYATFSKMDDYIPSFSTSVIVVGDSSIKTAEKQFVALMKKLEAEEHYYKYSQMLTILQKYDCRLREIVEYRCFMNSNFENMVYKFYLDRRQIAYYFNNACLIIAYLDNNIKFTITDYYNYYRRNHTLNYALQEVVRLLLNEARMKNTDTTKIFNFLTAELNRCKQEDTNEFINSIYRISYRYPEINLKISKKKYRKANENQSKGEIIIKQNI